MTRYSLESGRAGNSIKPETRDLAASALDFSQEFDVEKMAAKGISADDVDSAISAIESVLVPAKIADPEFASKQARYLRDRIGMIGRKIKPDLNRDAVKDWLGSLIIALSDLPYRISIEAAEHTIHMPFQYLSEVEAQIRKYAEFVQARFSAAKFRLERLKRRINHPPLLIEHKNQHDFTQSDIDDLAASEMGKALIRIGILNGWIAQNEDGTYSPIKEKQSDD